MHIVVAIKGVDLITITFLEILKRTFHGNQLCVKCEKKNIFYVILNLSDPWIDSMKGMFHKPNSDDLFKHRMNLNAFLILDTDTLVCSRYKLGKRIDLLLSNIREDTYLKAFMRFDLDSLSFKTEKKNKNDNEQNDVFASERDHQILCYKTLTDTNTSSISDILMSNADSLKGLYVYECASRKPRSKNKTYPPRIFHQTLESPPCIFHQTLETPPYIFHQTLEVCQVLRLYPYHGDNGNNPLVPDYSEVNRKTGNYSQRSVNTDPNSSISLQESIACMVQHPNQSVDQNDVRRSLQSLSLVDEQHLHNTPNINSGNNHTSMEYEVYAETPIQSQSVSQDGASSTRLEVGDPRSHICIGGSSFNRPEQFQCAGISSHNATASSPDYRLPSPMGVQQSRPFRPGLLGGSTSAQHQQYQEQHRETTFTEPARIQAVSQQRNSNDDLLRALGRVRSPEYADLTDRLDTFLRWPSDIAQTPDKVAEAGFYYTGFQDIVRCFVCDGGLKNWDPDDDPWVEHARWFPQCTYVRHVKGEEFINLVRMTTEESDEEDDYTVHRGATWGGAENSNTNANSALNEIAEPSVLESEDAQFVIEMGFSKKDVVMAINDIFKKGKQDFTGQEIADIILEKETRGELSNSMVSADCLPSVGNRSVTEQAMSENKHLKELLQCTECKTKQRNILFLPCTHHVVCESCSRDLHICTCCYRKIKEKVRTYMS